MGVLEGKGVRVFEEKTGHILGDPSPDDSSTPTPTPAPTPPVPPPSDPDAMQVDPPSAPAPSKPPAPAYPNDYPHYFTIPTTALPSLSSYISTKLTPLRRHLLSRLTKRLIRCSNLLSNSNPSSTPFTNPPDWWVCPIVRPSEAKKTVAYENWRGGQLTPGNFTLPPHKSFFTPGTVYDYKEHLDYARSFIVEQNKDFLQPPPSHHLRDKSIYERIHNDIVDPLNDDKQQALGYLIMLQDRLQAVLELKKRIKPPVEDEAAYKIYEGDKNLHEAKIKRVKDIQEKGSMTRKQHEDSMKNAVKRALEGKEI